VILIVVLDIIVAIFDFLIFAATGNIVMLVCGVAVTVAAIAALWVWLRTRR
jgi:hypothetical protein